MITRLVKAFFSPFSEGMVDYSSRGLTTLNGQQHIKGGIWKNLLINGQALLGGHKEKTTFEEMLVVNGDFKAENCLFDLLDVRGSFKMTQCVLQQLGIFYGTGLIQDCTASNLNLRSPGGSLLIKDSKINGDIEYSSMNHMFGSLTLENTTVFGSIITTKKDQGKVKAINCDSLNFKEIK